jgi:phosphomannomutase
MALDPELIRRAEKWAEEDPDRATRDELLALLAAPDPSKTDLADRFAGSLEFGTAGLRAVLGAGPNRMNRAVVLRTTWGLAQEVLASFPDAAQQGVVVGYDGRRYSREFALDTALALAAAGVPAHLSAHPVPTPITSFAVTHLGAVAGVMVTASHNPPEYNGYKAYWRNGAQIIPPIDERIAARIAKAPAAKDVPRLELAEAHERGLVSTVPDEVYESYLKAVRALAVHDAQHAEHAQLDGGDRSFPIVYTPMHGVGDDLARRALAEAGFSNVTSVPEQREPDGNFPTVAFPNPEEKGAMDLSFALGRKLGAKLILANDPDADRLAVAIPGGTPSGFIQLTGNQVGILLGHYLLTERPAEAGDRPVVLASIVSSPMLGSIARELGVRYEETLTGFKWIANRAMDLEKEGASFVFGYEEALGYTVGDLVRDKDGISAAVLVAEVTAVLATRKKTLIGELEAIYRRYGLFVSSQVNLTRKGAKGAEEIRELMDRLRKAPPKRVGDHDVEATSDYLEQLRVDARGTRTRLSLPKSNVLAFELKGGSRIIARPSGTEPKVKFYFDVREAVVEGESLAIAEARAGGVMKKLSDAFVALAG